MPEAQGEEVQRADVLVVGAGAAGLFAGLHAAQAGASVVVLEKNRKAGVKILASGGGRCNLTTTRSGKALERSFPAHQQRWLAPALRAFPPKALRAWFDEHGVPTHEEPLEKVFPDAERARVVVAALVEALEAAGGRLVTGAPAQSLERVSAGGFRVVTPELVWESPRLILALGGKSYPKTGTVGEGYRFVSEMGHSVTALHPHLAALLLDHPRDELAGLTLEDAAIAFGGEPGTKSATTFERPVLFTHKGLSGPGPMDLAGDVEAEGGATVRLAPAGPMRFESAEAGLMEASRAQPRRSVVDLLPRRLPARARQWLCHEARVDPHTPGQDLRREERRALAHALVGVPLHASGSAGYDHAEVTRGGVPLSEVDPKSMASRIVPGLHLCGELLDLDGPIGGFNFQAAFATGRIAGLSAATDSL